MRGHTVNATKLTMDIQSSGNVTGNHVLSKHSIKSHRTGVFDYIDVGTSNSMVKHVLCTVFFPLKFEHYDGGRGGGIWVNIAHL